MKRNSMQTSSTFLLTRNLLRSLASQEITCPVRISRSQWVAAALLGITAMLAQPARAQGFPSSSPQSTTQSPSSSSSQSMTQSPSGPGLGPMGASQSDGSQEDGSQDDRNSLSSASNLAVPASLSSDQIIHILQQNPDLVVELKSQVADHLQQQGTPIDANDISDQMLYSQIATNSDLRANITMFLRARGYVSQDDLQSLGSGSNVGTGDGSGLSGQEGNRFSGQSSVSAGTDTAGLPASGLSSPDQIDASGRATQLMGSVANQSSSEQKRGHEPVNASTDP